MDVFAVIAEPTRRQLLDVLADGPSTVDDLVDALGTSQPTVSKHVRVLRDAGPTVAEPNGPQRIYSVRPQGLRDVDSWLPRYRARWGTALDELEHLLDESETPT